MALAPVIAVRLVCAHDGVKTAQMLARMLAAEGYGVEISYGRASLEQLEQSSGKTEAIVMIWSLDAPVAHYMLQWRQRADPSRLIEIARARIWPEQARRQPVIDFNTWNGERGSAPWRAMQERLRAVERACAPPRPAPKRAALALGAVSALAASAALVMRVQDASQSASLPPAEAQTNAGAESPEGLGGPLNSFEPASVAATHLGPLASHVDPIEASTPPLLSESELAPPLIARDEPLLDRIAALAQPLFPTSEREPER